MTRAKNIKRGQWIREGQVTRVRDPGFGGPIEIEWKNGSRTGIKIRSPWLGVKRVYSPPERMNGKRGKR